MKRYHVFILLFLLLAALSACSPGHLGGNEIAFVRDGHLWTIDPDGSNAFEVVSDSTAVVGYAWSPDHRIFAFRQIDGGFATSSAGKHLAFNSLSGLPGDVPSSLNTVGIDGGMPIPIIGSTKELQRSNAWWNNSGTRLLYREESTLKADQNPVAVSWWVSQSDQPAGIARKSLPSSFSIPSFTSDSSLAIGNTQQGVYTTTLAGTNFTFLSQGALPGHPLPATLERLLWQPAHAHPLLLYAVPATAGVPPQPPRVVTPAVQLMLRDAGGQTRPLLTCYCAQFAWSPDGNSILTTSGSDYTVYNISQQTSFTFTAEAGSVPYWSPDHRFLLLDGLHSLTLLSLDRQQARVLLSDSRATTTPDTQAPIPDANALLQPIPNNLWASDSRHFLLLPRGRPYWQGQLLNAGNGLYTVAIDANGQPQGQPSLVASGAITQVGWSYEDLNTSFLFV